MVREGCVKIFGKWLVNVQSIYEYIGSVGNERQNQSVVACVFQQVLIAMGLAIARQILATSRSKYNLVKSGKGAILDMEWLV